jgi:hypothetical protein
MTPGFKTLWYKVLGHAEAVILVGWEQIAEFLQRPGGDSREGDWGHPTAPLEQWDLETHPGCGGAPASAVWTEAVSSRAGHTLVGEVGGACAVLTVCWT